MSENQAPAGEGTTPEPSNSEPTAPNQVDTTPAQTDAGDLGEGGLKALRAEREAHKAAVREAAALRKQVDASASALADAQAKVDAFERRDQLNVWREEVSKETNVPASVLRGDTLEEIKAHADALAPFIARARGPVIPTQGQQPEGTPATPAQLFVRQLFGTS